MPEMTVTVRWPDGSVEDCYSPSLVMHDHLSPATEYRVEDFTRRAVHALQIASDRVAARFGFACTSAAATSARIRARAATYDAEAVVEVLAMEPPLPTTEARR